jgi:ribonuclease R
MDQLNGAVDQDKVIVKILSWGVGSKLKPVGTVTTVLGKLDSNELEMNAILIQNGFNISFSEAVMEEAENISTEISPTEIEKRRDFRNITTFTIDPFDAKDFDDALSFRYLKEDRYEIGIHIADVSNYLKKGTEMDKEAYLRSTSVYLVDRCCPMLPEKLSNELCSLRPNEDKLTFSAVFTFDEKDQIVDKWFGKTIIHSNRRFTYEEAQTIIETKKGPYEKEITKLNEVALKLRKKRFRNGAINFESDEIGIKLDENKRPIAIYIKERKDSNKMIEEFMLLANKEVAHFISKKEKGIQQIPYIYRIHDLPNQEKVEDLLTFAMEFGFKLDPKNVAKSFNRLMLESEQNEALKVIIPLAIRTMAKAEYSTENIGHYGLAFEYYSHFTSPIRRYSDVIAHRLLEKNLQQIYRTDLATLDNQCSHISKQERKAMDCERESIKYKQVEFMEHSVGGTFKARVSGMSEKGFFAEMTENKCEGMVKFETLPENYELDATRLRAISRKSKKIIKIGDLVTVKVASADLKSRRIDLELVES